MAVRRVYVIELEAAAGRRRDQRIPWVYVGSTVRTPERRFEQHRADYKSARLVKRVALRLRPDLYEDIETLRSSKDAVRAEKARARELAECGFVAHCDGTSYGRDVADWAEWDEERLAPVAAHVDAAAAQLTEAAFRAGRYAARSPTAKRSPAMPANVTGSSGRVSYSCPRR